MTLQEELKKLVGRDVETVSVTYKGKQGFMPLFFNHLYKNRVLDLFAESEEECLTNLKKLLKSGDEDDTESGSERRHSEEDQGS